MPTPGIWVRAINVPDEGQIGRSLCYASDSFLRPARLLRKVPTYFPIPAAEILFEAVPACAGARFGAGTTLARAAQRVKATPPR